MRTVAILVVGDEILSGEVRDENAPFLVRALSEVGVRVVRTVTAPDERRAIVSELTRLRALADAVVVSGGMGPTHDDLTRPAVAEALGLPLEAHPEAEGRIRGWYGSRVTESELAMALMPRGASLVDGRSTSTFGFAVAGVFVLPGVPFLFRDIGGALPPRFERSPCHRTELRSERREGEIAPGLAALQGRATDVAIGSYPVYERGRWHVRVVLRADDPGRLDEVAREARGLLG